jgi:hypothetical protein
MVNEMELRQVFLRVLQLSPVSIIPSMLRTHSFIRVTQTLCNLSNGQRR